MTQYLKPTMKLFAILLVIGVGIPQARSSDDGFASPDKVAEVKAGSRTVAHASWWGFDTKDATACLQAAIQSGVPTLIVDNTGSDWLISDTVQLVSNQEIVFADGVVVAAKEGHFKGITDNMFEGNTLTNLTIRGEGHAVIKMRKADYLNPELYKLAEWRHAFTIAGCTNVVFRNLTIKDSGGDGIYLRSGLRGAEPRYSGDVLIEDVTFDGNNRLGMAVISAQNLIVRRCKFINALGASPQGGIDFEPNNPSERLVNILVEDSSFENNTKGAGISVSPYHLNQKSIPVSITIQNSVSRDNALGIFFYMSNGKGAPPRGRVDIVNCQIDRNPMLFQDPLDAAVMIAFKDCTIDNNSSRVNRGNEEALTIRALNPKGNAIGNIAFENTTVIDDSGRDPISIKYMDVCKLSESITGDLYLTRDGKTEAFDLVGFMADKRATLETLMSLRPMTDVLDRLNPGSTDMPRVGNDMVYLRRNFTFIQYAEAGQSITINARSVQVANYGHDTKLELYAPDGETLLNEYRLASNSEQAITFTAQTTGYYRVVAPGGTQRIDVTSPHAGNGILLKGGSVRFLPINAKDMGRLYFEVPRGVKKFALTVSSDAGADVALLDPEGRIVEKHQGIDSVTLLSATRSDASESEIWSIGVSNVTWQMYVQLYAPLPPVISTNPMTLPTLSNLSH